MLSKTAQTLCYLSQVTTNSVVLRFCYTLTHLEAFKNDTFPLLEDRIAYFPLFFQVSRAKTTGTMDKANTRGHWKAERKDCSGSQDWNNDIMMSSLGFLLLHHPKHGPEEFRNSNSRNNKNSSNKSLFSLTKAL